MLECMQILRRIQYLCWVKAEFCDFRLSAYRQDAVNHLAMAFAMHSLRDWSNTQFGNEFFMATGYTVIRGNQAQLLKGRNRWLK